MIAIYYDSKLDGFEFKVLNLYSNYIYIYIYIVFTLDSVSKSLHFVTSISKKEKEKKTTYITCIE